MSTIVSLLRPPNISLDLKVAGKADLFAQLARQAAPLTGTSEHTIVDSLRARESAGTTGLGMGVAIPHGRIKGLRDATVLFARLQPAIEFSAPDAKPVSLVFTLLVPAHADELHLQLLGELAQHLGSAAFRERLAAATDADAVLAAFSSHGA
ncbi:MAG: IIA-like nitrogen regulatory protein PtsN [Pseudomonadota bacterium]|jgi:PTS system nitrogen regulatory IIA component